jgi:glycosyltransferase involved in cell wall biosynthesis
MGAFNTAQRVVGTPQMKENDPPVSISVVIPCYNAAEFLQHTISTVLNQTCKPKEIIIIDDGSDDRSVAIASRCEPFVRVIRQPNQGPSAARNRGIAAASGDWIAFLDADDVWEPTKLEKQVQAIVDNSLGDLVCVYTDFYFLKNGEKTREQRPEYHSLPDYRVKMLCDWSIIVSSSMVRATALSTVRFPVNLRDAEDMIFHLELRDLGRFKRVPEALAGYRRHSGNVTNSPAHQVRAVQTRLEWLLSNLDKYSEKDQLAVRRSLLRELIHPHYLARESRDVRLTRRCRRLCRQLAPNRDDQPPEFLRPVYPRWVYRIKDALGPHG